MAAGMPMVCRTAALLLLGSVCGCATFGTPGDLPSTDDSPVASAVPAASPVPSLRVRLQPSGDEPTEVTLPLGETRWVQSVIEQSGASRRFRRMKIELYRPLASGYHRLDVPYDRAERRVRYGADYALHPGDLLVITEDTSTALDDVLATLQIPNIRAGRR